MRAGLASPTKTEAWEDTSAREMSRIMRVPVWEGFSTTAGADATEGSTISSRTSDGLITDEPKTNTTDDTGMVTNDFSRSAKTAEKGYEERQQRRVPSNYIEMQTTSCCICSTLAANEQGKSKYLQKNKT